MKKPLIMCIALLFSASFVSGCAFSQTTPTKIPPKPGIHSAAKVELVDINSATREQLAQLPGIGAAYSEKIIKSRPYAKKDQLLSKNVIPKATYEKIKDLIIARQK